MDSKATRLAAAKVRRTLDSHLRGTLRLRFVETALQTALRALPREDRPAVLESCVQMLVERRESDPKRPWLYSRAALIIAGRFVAEGLTVPVALPLLIDAQTFDLAPWRAALSSLDDAGARKALAHLRATTPAHLQGQLAVLRLRAGESPQLFIEELERQILETSGVNVGLLVQPFAMLADSAIEPLVRRIEALTPAATSGSYKERRVVLALRNALAFAVVATERSVEELEEHFLLTPAALFVGNNDYAYSFLRALPRSLFAKASEAWIVRWLDVWSSSPALQDEQRGLVRNLLPNDRKHLFPLNTDDRDTM